MMTTCLVKESFWSSRERLVRTPCWKPILLAFGCPDGVWVGSGVSEVLAAFVTSLNRDVGWRCGRQMRDGNIEVQRIYANTSVA
jgi:hypothetical protein